MSHPDEQNRVAWEARSKLFGASLRSVLFKGLPDAVNEHLDKWHKDIILHSIKNKNELRILDVGCGYGRLSSLILERFSEAEILGIDMCENYVKLYVERMGRPAWVERIENIPDRLGTFDYIICVTVLMYLDLENLRKAISNLLAHLKPDGTLVLIEPDSSGKPFQTGFGLLTSLSNRLGGKVAETGGRYFRPGEIKGLFNLAGGGIVSEERLPFTSLFFLPIALIGQLLSKRMSKKIYGWVSVFDALLGGLKLPSIYVAYLISRK
jgi:2-polyprenyl-3-methyl-5-hydroxy-6-metoxy-1,4-benzoquinol methylase